MILQIMPIFAQCWDTLTFNITEFLGDVMLYSRMHWQTMTLSIVTDITKLSV